MTRTEVKTEIRLGLDLSIEIDIASAISDFRLVLNVGIRYM